MKDNGWSVSVESFSGDQHRVLIRLSAKYARLLADRHSNVTAFVMERVIREIDFIDQIPVEQVVPIIAPSSENSNNQKNESMRCDIANDSAIYIYSERICKQPVVLLHRSRKDNIWRPEIRTCMLTTDDLLRVIWVVESLNNGVDAEHAVKYLSE